METIIAMDLLRSNLSRVRIPEHTNRIYKQECCISYDTPMSEGGLFVDMNSFLAFGKDFVCWNYEKTGNAVYLHLKQTRKLFLDGRPSKKPTLFSIGMESGFDNSDTGYEETHSIVILPDFVTLSFPSVELPEKVRLAADAIILSEGAEKKEQLATWTADKKQVSAYAMDLQQIDRGITVPPSGWKCAMCDKKENLWLNLTDGVILCGRRNWDGTGGNNHAFEHYRETGYPLAVKLGTITADLEESDVFSYPEDDCVVDPLLGKHLAFFGIDFSSLHKTELTTSERELDQNINFDWNRIQENGRELELVFGPGYTGLLNLGNSCYMAATMQAVFSTHSFSSRYYTNQSLRMAFDMAPADPTVDLNMQLTKLAHGLLSGKYSMPSVEEQEGISPRMFKTVIASSHLEFSCMRQQDALEFFLHFLDQVEHTNVGTPMLDPSRSFKFGIEERLVCVSGKVAYNKRDDYILSLNIPLHEATNKEEVKAYDKQKSNEQFVSSNEIVRPRVPLQACLDNFSSPEEITDFYSSALHAKTTVTKTAGLTSFPDYLVLHMRKFVFDEGWVPRKLDVYIDVPDYIDITHMRSKGLQPGEELLADVEPEEMEAERVVADEDIVSQLLPLGFDRLRCEKAVISTSNAGAEEAMNWLLAHLDDPEFSNSVSQDKYASEVVDDTKVSTLVSLGFGQELASQALQEMGGDIAKAADWIFNNPSASISSDMHSAASNPHHIPSVTTLPDGEGKYKLYGIVSHIGTSTQCGHYVAHVYKDGRWVIFNDSKVGISTNPPKDMGYLYFFERLQG